MRWLLIGIAGYGVAYGQDVYLYSKRLLRPGGIDEEIARLGGPVSSGVSELASSADDGLGDVLELGFSFPTFDASRLRSVVVEPNGALRTFDFQPPGLKADCKQVDQRDDAKCSSCLCNGFSWMRGSIAPLATDLWAGAPLLRRLNVTRQGTVSWRKGPAFASVVWSKRLWRYVDLVQAGEPGFVSVGATLFPDGRISFYYQHLPAAFSETSSKVWASGMFAWTGLRSRQLLSNAYGRLSENDISLRSTWSARNGGSNLTSAGYLVRRSDVMEGNVLDLCMIPDHDLGNQSLPVSQVCLNISISGDSALVQGPEALFGCMRAGIELRCLFSEFFSSQAFAVTSSSIRCDLPQGNVTDLLAVAQGVVLEYVNVYSLGGGNRAIKSRACEQVSGFPLNHLSESNPCPIDEEFGEPGIRDCSGECGGTKVLDGRDACCERSTLDCRGLCIDEESKAFKVANMRGTSGGGGVPRISFALDSLECCAPSLVDCSGTCGGYCVKEDCSVGPDPLCANLGTPTLPTPSRSPSPDPGQDTQNRERIILYFFASLASIMVITLVRFGTVCLFRNEAPPWLLRALHDGSREPVDRLAAEEIEKYTERYQVDSASDESCAICISGFEEKENCRKLPCAHAFHDSCIEMWFQRSTRCPMCKQDVRGEDAPPPRVESLELGQVSFVENENETGERN